MGPETTFELLYDYIVTYVKISSERNALIDKYEKRFFNGDGYPIFPQNLVNFGLQTANTNCVHGMVSRLELPRVVI